MRTLIFIISTLLSSTLFAQDIHFSQNLISRVSINPSLIGHFSDNDYRISLHRRSQWESVSKPFTTFLMSVEAKKISYNRWEAYTENGRERTGKNVNDWIREAINGIFTWRT